MKEKIRIALSRHLLAQIGLLAGSRNSRSALIARILHRYIRDRRRAAPHARDLARINRAAYRLNRESADVLEYVAVKARSYAERIEDLGKPPIA